MAFESVHEGREIPSAMTVTQLVARRAAIKKRRVPLRQAVQKALAQRKACAIVAEPEEAEQVRLIQEEGRRALHSEKSAPPHDYEM